MRVSTAALLASLACLLLNAWGCDLGQYQNGCKIYASTCQCGYGCKTDYIYRSRRDCRNALKAAERNSNICSAMPCARGICLQTVQEPGFTCKCEGTGYYGRRCEKACHTEALRMVIFPHECIVI